jgi:hypothetical protein
VGKIYRVSRAHKVTQEEKAVAKITTILSDFSLDLEAVGKYLATATPHIIYRRGLEVLEAMEYNKQVAEYNHKRGEYGE